AKKIMSKASVPLVPGYHGDDQDPEVLKQQAIECGFPLLLKATAGGGGKGMRVVNSVADFAAALSAAMREAKNAFGDSKMLIERYMTQTRHIEVQVFCDQHGNAAYLSQRDCSIQRRHQKIVEEAPAPGIDEAVVKAMGEAAINAAKAINYVGAGTVEFLYNEDQSFYFMEMNTRLQVEHPVTEMITKVDLVQWQLQIASGEKLPLSQSQVTVSGHAIECRVYAEDPNNDFLPATGQLDVLRTPVTNEHVRIDSGVDEGDQVSVYYDPMIAKLIVWGENRQQAIARMQKALGDYRIVGVKNNIAFLHSVISSPAFANAEVDTQFIEKNREALFSEIADHKYFLAIASCCQILAQANNAHADRHNSPFSHSGQWRLNQIPCTEIQWQPPGDDQLASDWLAVIIEVQSNLTSARSQCNVSRSFSVSVGDSSFEIQASLSGDQLCVSIDGKQIKIHAYSNKKQLNLFYSGLALQYQLPDIVSSADDSHTDAALCAPMNGRVIAVLIESGQHVTSGTPLIIIEAMKMEHSIVAPHDGTVEDIYFIESDLVAEGDTLIALSATADTTTKAAP
ncbi:MAG: ATP-grasp domain-containing protein, partial [Pseudomonadales bacterium]|nr:ATP-grasp domain-containing protein [Pseudomonadales bacterium]